MDMLIDFPGGKKVSASYRGYTLLTDQPESVGGDGEAPSPFDLFLCSLGTCAGYYVLMFCKERDIETEGLSINLKTEKKKGERLISKVKVEILLPPTFPLKYRKAIVAAANACTVKKLLFTPPDFEVMTTIL